VAAQCRNGVACIAAHTPASPDSDEEGNEPLLYHHSLAEAVPGSGGDQEENESTGNKDGHFLDLPGNFGGPFRIQSVDSFGTSLLSTGWRADCDSLVERCRALAAAELKHFGPPPSASGRAITSRSPGFYGYGRFMASELSLYMAQCAVLEGRRPMSCAGLLVCPAGETLLSKNSCCLWLVDSTGAYPVRAHCLGGGLIRSGVGKEEETLLISDVLNRRLMQQGPDTFLSLTAEEGLQCLLSLLSSDRETQESDLNKEREQRHSLPPLFKPYTRLELAVVDSAQRRMVRKKLDSFHVVVS
jgi:hypothetical protein